MNTNCFELTYVLCDLQILLKFIKCTYKTKLKYMKTDEQMLFSFNRSTYLIFPKLENKKKISNN